MEVEGQFEEHDFGDVVMTDENGPTLIAAPVASSAIPDARTPSLAVASAPGPQAASLRVFGSPPADPAPRSGAAAVRPATAVRPAVVRVAMTLPFAAPPIAESSHPVAMPHAAMPSDARFKTPETRRVDR